MIGRMVYISISVLIKAGGLARWVLRLGDTWRYASLGIALVVVLTDSSLISLERECNGKAKGIWRWKLSGFVCFGGMCQLMSFMFSGV